MKVNLHILILENQIEVTIAGKKKTTSTKFVPKPFFTLPSSPFPDLIQEGKSFLYAWHQGQLSEEWKHILSPKKVVIVVIRTTVFRKGIELLRQPPE